MRRRLSEIEGSRSLDGGPRRALDRHGGALLCGTLRSLVKRFPACILVLLAGLTTAGALAAAAHAQLSPGDLDKRVFASVTAFTGDPSRTFVTEVSRTGPNSLRARFSEADASGSVASRRLITETSVPLGTDRMVEREAGAFLQEPRQCFLAVLRSGSVEILSFDTVDPDASSSGGFDAQSGRFCAAPQPADVADPDGLAVGRRGYLVGRSGSGPASRTFGRPLYQPRTMRTRAGVLLVRFRWRGWTRRAAVGRGNVRVNARGRFSRSLNSRGDFRRARGARVTLSGLTRGVCRGRPAIFYTRALMRYPRGVGLPRRQTLRLAATCGRE